MTKIKEIKESAVGYATTSILEDMCKEYIDHHTIRVMNTKLQIVRQYIGDPQYLTAYKKLVEYNRGNKK